MDKLHNLSRPLAATGLMLFSALPQAHTGHDHSHWASDMVHALLAISVFAAVSTGLLVAYRAKTAAKRENTGR